MPGCPEGHRWDYVSLADCKLAPVPHDEAGREIRALPGAGWSCWRSLNCVGALIKGLDWLSLGIPAKSAQPVIGSGTRSSLVLSSRRHHDSCVANALHSDRPPQYCS
jgi:hypothetical protein